MESDIISFIDMFKVYTFLSFSSIVERSVVGLLRLAIRLLHKEEVSSQVLLTLRILLLMKHDVLQDCGRQISFGLHELIRTNASSITCSRDWVTVFALLECVGARIETVKDMCARECPSLACHNTQTYC